MIVNLQFAGEVEACVLVELDVSFHLQKTNTHILGFLYRILQQFQAVALALVVGMNTDGTESPRRVGRSIVKHNLCFRKHHMSDNLTRRLVLTIVFLHHKVQLWDEVGIRPILIEHVMLSASRTIDVPECLTRQVFYLTIIFGLF